MEKLEVSLPHLLLQLVFFKPEQLLGGIGLAFLSFVKLSICAASLIPHNLSSMDEVKPLSKL